MPRACQASPFERGCWGWGGWWGGGGWWHEDEEAVTAEGKGSGQGEEAGLTATVSRV